MSTWPSKNYKLMRAMVPRFLRVVVMDEPGETGSALVFHAKGFICGRKKGRASGGIEEQERI